MKGTSRRDLIARLCGVLGVGLVGATAWAGVCWGCRKPAVDMPISLVLGIVRTAEFPVQRQPYLIMIRTKKHLPFHDLNCMLGLETALPDPKCSQEPLLQADWVLWDQGQVVDHGSVHSRDGRGAWADASIDRLLGQFVGERNKKYVLEVKFTKDGSALNVTNPHLIVMMTKPTDF
jgi:hypothetical protein